MDIALKQRLVGATILIALAVIFLPLLLDGENRDGQSTQPIEIPERPDVDFQTRRLPIGDHGQAGDPSETGAGLPESPQPRPETPVVNDTEPEAEPEPVVKEPAPKPVVKKPVPKPEVKDPPPQPVKQDVSGNWLVQVGSFSSLDNANRLGKELDGLGYAAMLEAGSNNSDSLVRVKIGPFVSEADAGQAVQRVRSAIPGVKPRVMSAEGKGQTAPARVSGWVVQLGSFSASENAARRSASLRQQGFTVFTDTETASSGLVYKVRTGAVAGRAEAEQLRERIRVRSGIAGMVINLSE